MGSSFKISKKCFKICKIFIWGHFAIARIEDYVYLWSRK